MKRLFSTLIIYIGICAVANAVSPMKMRFHCENDTLKINNLLEAGLNSNISCSNELMVYYAKQLLDIPYIAHTLEGDTEMLTINIDELDCTTYVETVYALARTTLSQRTTWRDFASNLESVRYRNGEMTDYASRLHYISDWIMNNSARGNVKEITTEFGGCKYIIKTIDFMSKHREYYPAMADSTIYEKIRNYEIGYRSHRFPYIKKELLYTKNIINEFESGDIIAMVTKTEGLDISHLGLVLKENNKLYFINASMGGKKVQIEKSQFADYMKNNRNCIGVRVFRIIP